MHLISGQFYEPGWMGVGGNGGSGEEMGNGPPQAALPSLSLLLNFPDFH